MIRRLTVMLAAAAALTFGLTADATAAPFNETPCTGNPATDFLAWWGEPDPVWNIDGICPQGYTISLGGELSTGQTGGGWAHENFPEAPITGVSAFMSGNNGSELGYTQGLLACRENVCSEILTIPDAAEPNGTWVSLDDEDIPEDANRIVARGVCVAGPCSPGDALLVSNLTITREDDTPPFSTLKEVVREIDENGDEVVSLVNFDETKWRSGITEFFGDPAIDLESYLLYFQVNVGSIEYCGPFTYVYMNPPVCEMRDENFTPSVDAKDLDDGLNTLTFKLVNGAGLSTSDSVDLLIDHTPPSKPVSLQVTPRRNNWSLSRNVRIDWQNGSETVTTETASGLAAVEYDVDPILGGEHPPDPATDPGPVVDEGHEVDSLSLTLPGEGEWSVTLRTIDKAGNPSPWATTDIKVDSSVPTAPVVEAIAPIGAAAAQAGITIDWSRESESISGVCGADYSINRQSSSNPGEDPATPMIADDSTSAFIPAGTISALEEGLNHLHLRSYSCAGTPGVIAHAPVMIDLTSPTAIASLDDDPAIDGDERILISASDANGDTAQSGLSSITYTLNGATFTVDAPSVLIDPPSGQVTLDYFATDNVGNVSDTQSAEFLIDRADPFGSIELSSPADPTRVGAVVGDTDSGIAEASLEFRASTGGPWIRAGERFKPVAPQFGLVRFDSQLPYEDSIADGAYVMRVKLVDGAGRVAYLTRRTTGEPAGFVSPLRQLPKLTAGLTRTSGTASPVSKLTVDYGRSARVSGRLTSPGGEPLAGVPLEIVAERVGALRLPVADVQTDGEGKYSAIVRRGTNRTLNVRFAGDRRFRSTDEVAKLAVRGRITLRIDKKKIHSGRRVMLRGKVYGEVLPPRGKSVEIEFLVGNRVSPIKLTRHANIVGGFEIPFTPRVRRTVRYRMRAVAHSELGWPYETARSAEVVLVVKR